MNHNFSRIDFFAEGETNRLAKTVTAAKHSQFKTNPSHRLYNDKRERDDRAELVAQMRICD